MDREAWWATVHRNTKNWTRLSVSMKLFSYQVMSDLFGTSWTVAHQAPLSIRFPRQESCSGLPLTSQGIFPTQGWNLCLVHWKADSLPLYHVEGPMSNLYLTVMLLIFVASSNKRRYSCTHGHHQMVNTEIILIILFAAENGEALYSQQKQDRKLTVAQITSSLLQKSDTWKKVWKTTRPFRYDLNQIFCLISIQQK